MFLGLSCCGRLRVPVCVILDLFLMTPVNVECDPAVAHTSVSFGGVFIRCDWFESVSDLV